MGLCFKFVLKRDNTRGKFPLLLSRASAEAFSASLAPSKEHGGRHWGKERSWRRKQGS